MTALLALASAVTDAEVTVTDTDMIPDTDTKTDTDITTDIMEDSRMTDISDTDTRLLQCMRVTHADINQLKSWTLDRVVLVERLKFRFC